MIKVKKEDTKIEVELTNGHKDALEKIVKDYNLKGEEQALLFILAVASDGEGEAIKTKKGSFVPPDSFKIQANDNQK